VTTAENGRTRPVTLGRHPPRAALPVDSPPGTAVGELAVDHDGRDRTDAERLRVFGNGGVVHVVHRDLARGTRDLVDEVDGLLTQVRRTITAFLLTQMNNGAFRSREPAKAFFVDVSDQLNTPSVIFAGKLIARVGLATNKPAEFIVLRISQDTRALEAELAAAGA
jgi:hypothetical protein